MTVPHLDAVDVVAVGAHPDDVEIACGGTLARLVQSGYRVAIIDLTDGEPTPLSPGPEVRLAEARAAADKLGVQVRVQLDLPNRRLFDCFEARVALAAALRRLRPRLVLGLGDKTPLASPDHAQAVALTDAAVFYSRLSKWEEHFGGLPVHHVHAQMYYTLGFSSLEPLRGPGHVVADISDTLELKLASIRCYATQFPPAKAPLFDRLRALNVHYGAAAGFAAGELFTTTRAAGTRDLLRFASEA